MSQQWQVATNSAQAYQEYLVPALFAYWVPLLVELAEPQADEQILDVACGTGVVTRYVAQQMSNTGRVVGLDVSPAMLAVARSLLWQGKTAIEWQEANALAMPFAEGEFDLLLCQQGLQFFPDRTAGLKEMYRVLKPGGRLALNVWRSLEHNPGYNAFSKALEEHISSAAGTFMRSPFGLGEREELFGLIENAGFHNIKIEPTVGKANWPSVKDFVNFTIAGTPLAGLVSETDEAARTALINTTHSALSAYVGTEGLRFPTESHLVLAYK